MAKEKKKEEKQEEKISVNLDPKLSKILDQIGELSVLELSDLVKGLEEKFGVQAMAAAPVAASSAGGQDAGGAPAEEKTQFTVVLTETGANKINVIKALREIKPDLGLKEAKDMTEKLPAEVLVDVKKDQAEEAQKKLGEAGAKVELK
ncbi:MAG: 50S ribosomal protein L7/L12 [Candidatus Shapirobacteria bacterium]